MNKKIEEKTNPNGKYGFISMVAMVIGIVVGSGIFVKNSEVIDGTGSAILTSIAWIVGGLIVLCMMMGFLEISSSSRLKNEQGTILNWSRNFLGKTASMIIGYYITFLYIPLFMVGLSFFAADFLLDAINAENLGIAWGFIFITIVGMLFLIVAQVVNALTSKPGKIFQTAGTFIKLIPLFGLILIAFVAIAASSIGIDTNAVFDPGSDINNIEGKGIDSGGAGHFIVLIFLVLPGILFAFDGFLYADALSLEAKKESTYKKALIFSIIFIVILYVLFSLSTMALAQQDENGIYAFDTKTIFETVFPKYGKTIGTIIVIFILISVLVAINGLSTISSRNLSDVSHQNLIKDKDGVLLRRNHSEAPYNAAAKIFIFVIIFSFVIRAGDAMMITWKEADGIYANGNDLQLTGIATSLSGVLIFFMYGLILIGGVVNRFTKKITVEKSFGFIFFAIVAMIFMVASAGFFIWNVVIQDIVLIANWDAGKNNDLLVISKELFATVFFLTTLGCSWIAIFIYNYNHIKEADFDNYLNKINAKKTYDALISYKNYEKAVFVNSNFSTLVDHPEKLDYEWYLKQQELFDKKIVHEKEELHIRSFLPLKFQEKFIKEKLEASTKEVYKLNKQVRKEINISEKETLDAKKEKNKEDFNLGKLKIEKGFNELENNLILEGVDFNLKSSKSELHKIAQEYLSISVEQLDSRFEKHGIKIANLKTKGQKYNLLKEFQKTNIQKLEAQLDHYKITYEQNMTKGELFSLLKNKE